MKEVPGLTYGETENVFYSRTRGDKTMLDIDQPEFVKINRFSSSEPDDIINESISPPYAAARLWAAVRTSKKTVSIINQTSNNYYSNQFGLAQPGYDSTKSTVFIGKEQFGFEFVDNKNSNSEAADFEVTTQGRCYERDSLTENVYFATTSSTSGKTEQVIFADNVSGAESVLNSYIEKVLKPSDDALILKDNGLKIIIEIARSTENGSLVQIYSGLAPGQAGVMFNTVFLEEPSPNDD